MWLFLVLKALHDRTIHSKIHRNENISIIRSTKYVDLGKYEVMPDAIDQNIGNMRLYFIIMIWCHNVLICFIIPKLSNRWFISQRFWELVRLRWTNLVTARHRFRHFGRRFCIQRCIDRLWTWNSIPRSFITNRLR